MLELRQRADRRPVAAVPAAGRTAPALSFRPEIEGLRALAVLLVVLDHLAGRPRGGFVGVDVFFVISGYLITGLLAREHAATGRISIVGFYRRRVRRILPAALTVLVATWVVARLLFLGSRAHQTAIDVYWAAAFSANIHFAAIDTNYFQANRPQSPVQHFWSLAVEEQFYVVWPLALILLLWLSRRLLPRRPLALAGAAAAATLAALFVLALRLTADNSAHAYFATPARAWELGAGAVLALAVTGRLRWPAWAAEAAMAVGIATVLVAAGTTPEGHGFPAPAAAPAVVGALLVILAGSTGRPTLSGRLLTNPAARYVGRLSYSLYLWHWPVIIFVQARLVGSTGYVRTVEICLMIALTLASNRLIEEPIRRRGLGALRVRRRVRAARPADGRLTAGGYTAVAVTACVLLAFVTWQVQPPRASRVFDTTAADAVPAAAARRSPGQVVPPASLASAIDRALDAGSFPSLHPALDDLPSATVPEWHPCGNVGPRTLAGCTFARSGTGTKSVVVIGDSIGITWLPAVRGLQRSGYSVYGLTFGQCPAATIDVKPSVGAASDFRTKCSAHRAFALAQVRRLHPSVVVLASSAETISRLADGATGRRADAEWQAATETTARRVRAAGAKRVVVLAPPPPAPDLQTCAASPASRPQDCVSRLSERYLGLSSAEAAAAKATHAAYLDVRLLFCAANGYCPSFVGSTPVRVDGLHLTQGYSASLAPILDPLITGPGR